MKKLIVIVSSILLFAGVAAAEMTKGEYGNHCAYGLTSGQKVMTDCSINWVDTNTNKTYCFSSEQAKTDFAKDTAGMIVKAESNYKQILAGMPAKTEMKEVQ